MTFQRLRQLLACAAALLLIQAPVRAASHPSFQVEVSGAGQPIILIPGLASSGEVWNGTVARYCGNHQCHVLTLAGFAGVPPVDAPLLPAVEQQLSDYISALGMDHPLVIGHSLGGYLALKLAADHPQQVGRLVIVDALPALGAAQLPSATPAQLKEIADSTRSRMLQQDGANAIARQRQVLATMISKPADIERAAGWGQRSDRASVANSMAELLQDDLRRDIGRIQAPTLVLGSWIAYRDYATREAIEQNYRQQYRALAGVRIALADTARHFIMYDDPDWMYARIDDFLKN
ncbi:MAG: alpha/beta hydrolase [Pseudomonadota bacterium]